MSNYRYSFLCFVALLPLWLFSVTAQAQIQSPAPADEPLTVTNVMIDKTDKNAVTARDQAIVEAQRLAFQRFAERSMTPEAFKDYKLPDDKTIATLVRDFEIRNEQISANRYMANFTVRFNAEAEDYINSSAVGEDSSPAASSGLEETPPSVDIAAPLESKTVLVLPYLRDIFGDKDILWEDPNPWRETWQAKGNSAPQAGLTFIVPSGDIADIAQGSSDAVWHDDYSVIEKLRASYKADAAVLAVAYKAGAYVQADIYIYKAGRLERQKPLKPYAGADAYKTVFQQAAARIASDMRQARTLPEAAEGGLDAMPPSLQELSAGVEKTAEKPPAPVRIRLDATMDFDGFPQWIEAQNRLSAAAPSAVVEISSLRKNAARFTIAVEWAGGLNGFKKALAEKGLELEKSDAADSSRRPLYILTMN
ncbi:MAG: DUF2066 domain-containing protein [Alphaproteobacteria bacterium]|nr:DUF2066 domain-containing protein [Alphaproteobacteria bacterium]